MRRLGSIACAAATLIGCRTSERFSTPISTDRPGLLYASTVVPRGAFQLELGVPSLSWNRNGSDDDVVAGLALAGRYGLSEVLELRVGGVPLAHAELESGPGSVSESGGGDAELGFKLALPELGTAALLASATLPTGERPFTVDDPAFVLALIAERALSERDSFKWLAGWTRVPQGQGDDLDSLYLGALAGRSFDGGLGLYAEAVAFPALESGPDPAYLGAGATLPAGRDSQWDVSLDCGLGPDSKDWIFTAGWSIRY